MLKNQQTIMVSEAQQMVLASVQHLQMLNRRHRPAVIREIIRENRPAVIHQMVSPQVNALLVLRHLRHRENLKVQFKN